MSVCFFNTNLWIFHQYYSHTLVLHHRPNTFFFKGNTFYYIYENQYGSLMSN